MATEVRVPTTGNAGEPAVVLEWRVAVGDAVAEGDVVATLETAKAAVDIDAPTSGTVLDIRFEEGDEASEHEVLFVLGEPGEASPPAPSEPPEPVATEEKPDAAPVAATSATPPARTRISISPRARRVAEASGVDIADVAGTGPFGRILVSDIEAAARSAAPVSAPSSAIAAPPAGERAVRRVPVRGARKVTAQRMHASLQGTAQVTLTRYASADAMLVYLDRLRLASDAHGAQRIGVNDLLLFATARTVLKHPAANAWFDWDAITEFDHVDLGFAVDTGRALLVPVIRNAHELSLAELARDAQLAIARARDGRTAPSELEGGTFTVSNLGGAGIHWFTPVLNPPQTCILGIGAVHRAMPDAPGQLPLSLTFDHRALDGMAAAALLADLALAIEHVDTLAAF